MSHVSIKQVSTTQFVVKVEDLPNEIDLERLTTLIRDTVEAMVASESALCLVEDALPAQRHRAVMALHHAGMIHASQAQQFFWGIIDVARGNVDVSDFGFPEFSDDAEEIIK